MVFQEVSDLLLRDAIIVVRDKPPFNNPLSQCEIGRPEKLYQIPLRIAIAQSQTSAELFCFAFHRIVTTTDSSLRFKLPGDPSHTSAAGVLFQ